MLHPSVAFVFVLFCGFIDAYSVNPTYSSRTGEASASMVINPQGHVARTPRTHIHSSLFSFPFSTSTSSSKAGEERPKVGLFRKQNVGGRLNISLFSSRQVGTGMNLNLKNRTRKNPFLRNGGRKYRIMDRNAKLASLVKLANTFEDVISNEGEVEIADYDHIGSTTDDADVTRAFSVNTDFETNEKKVELDLALGTRKSNSKLSGSDVRKQEMVSALSVSKDSGDRAFAMLLDLGMVDVHLDPEDDLYDHEYDSLYAPDNNWINYY